MMMLLSLCGLMCWRNNSLLGGGPGALASVSYTALVFYSDDNDEATLSTY